MEKTSDRLKLFCTYANAKRLAVIKNPVETWTMKKCEASLHNEEKGRARHSMCERQDENAMKNKFQFNWTAT